MCNLFYYIIGVKTTMCNIFITLPCYDNFTVNYAFNYYIDEYITMRNLF